MGVEPLEGERAARVRAELLWGRARVVCGDERVVVRV